MNTNMKKGDRFGKLVFIENCKVEFNGITKSIGIGKFLCDCGREYFGNINGVLTGNAKSCGCLLKEISLPTAMRTNIIDGTNVGKILKNEPTKRNKTGIVGVNWDKNKRLWEGNIGFKGKKYKKRFKSFDDAVDWRRDMENKLFKPFLNEINFLNE